MGYRDAFNAAAAAGPAAVHCTPYRPIVGDTSGHYVKAWGLCQTSVGTRCVRDDAVGGSGV